MGRIGRLARRVHLDPPVVLLLAALLGVIALLDTFGTEIDLYLLSGVALVVALRVLGSREIFGRLSRGLQIASFIPGAIAVPIVALVGVDSAWEQIVRHRPEDPAVSLVIGGAVLVAAQWAYLSSWWIPVTVRKPFWWSLAAGYLLVLAPPTVFFVAARFADETPLPPAQPLINRLEVIVVEPATGNPTRYGREIVSGWIVDTRVGLVDGGGATVWRGDQPPSEEPPRGATRVVLLSADGALSDARLRARAAASNATLRRLARAADRLVGSRETVYGMVHAAAVPHVMTFVWEDILRRKPAVRVDVAGPISLARLRSERKLRSPAEIGYAMARLETVTPADLALARRHRPAIFLDRGERMRPMDIDAILASKELRLCHGRGQAFDAGCDDVQSVEDLHNGASHLSFDPRRIADIGGPSPVYVNVRRSGNVHPNTIYLDYWWYFPHNPTEAGGGALCGAGFVIAGVTCFDHPSDWEGVTVILDEDDPGTPTHVAYAQHDGVHEYSWRALRKLWERDRARFGKGIGDLPRRPLVFVARGTHASYPQSCRRTKCAVGSLPGLPAPRDFDENRHDGRRAWSGNAACDDCVKLLPTTARGHVATSWNAFEGFWGAANCILGVICTSSDPPRSPGQQSRFAEPWCPQDSADYDAGTRRFRPADRRCDEELPTETQLDSGWRWLSLGDAFAAGEGAGSYYRATTSGDAPCYRSSASWARRLALEVDAAFLPSPACSSGTVEAQVHKVGRDIHDVFVTAGADHAGFRTALDQCVRGDCSGDADALSTELEADVRRKLIELLRAVRHRAPEADIWMVGYPRLFQRDGAIGSCSTGRRVRPAEARHLDEILELVNRAARAAARSRAEFLAVEDALDGHEMRCDGASFVKPLTRRGRRVEGSLYPNSAGHARLAEEVKERMSGR